MYGLEWQTKQIRKINELYFSKVKINHLKRLFEYFHIGFPAVTSRYKLVQLTTGNYYGTNHSTY